MRHFSRARINLDRFSLGFSEICLLLDIAGLGVDDAQHYAELSRIIGDHDQSL